MKFDSYGRFLKSDLYQVVEVNVLFVTINVCLLVLILIITLNIKLGKKPQHENVQYMANSGSLLIGFRKSNSEYSIVSIFRSQQKKCESCFGVA